VVTFAPLSLYPRNRRLSGPESSSGHGDEKKIPKIVWNRRSVVGPLAVATLTEVSRLLTSPGVCQNKIGDFNFRGRYIYTYKPKCVWTSCSLPKHKVIKIFKGRVVKTPRILNLGTWLRWAVFCFGRFTHGEAPPPPNAPAGNRPPVNQHLNIYYLRFQRQYKNNNNAGSNQK
jgi:hypothetical protein